MAAKFAPILHAAGNALSEPALPAAAFSDLPARKILTLNMDVPEPWLVEPTQARLVWHPNLHFWCSLSTLCIRCVKRVSCISPSTTLT